ncbi:MAG: DUF3153 domain-containing protein [Anaerolineae bacterium]|nr:DUF3153 domain-containing protein [Anaerolineae bacterium]
MKTRLSIPFFCLLALFLSACSFNVTTVVESDGSGTWKTEIGFNAEDQALLSSFGMGASEVCQEMQADGELPAGAQISTEERDGSIWCVVEQSFATLAELRQLHSEGDGITVNRLEILDDQFHYDLSLDMRDAEASLEEMQELGEFALDFTWRLTVPGKVVSHNADAISGNTLTWNLTPGTIISLQAESDLSSGGSTWLILLLCCLCLVVMIGAGVGGFLFWRSRQKAA